MENLLFQFSRYAGSHRYIGLHSYSAVLHTACPIYGVPANKPTDEPLKFRTKIEKDNQKIDIDISIKDLSEALDQSNRLLSFIIRKKFKPVSKKDPKLHLQDIFKNIKNIEVYMKRINKKAFSHNKKIQDAVMYRFIIIGEIAEKLSKNFRKISLQLKLDEIIGMKNILISKYSSIDINIVWNTVKNDIPELKSTIIALLNLEKAGFNL